MAKKVSRKELLKGPDEFLTLSERAAAYVQEHSRAFISAGVAVAVLLVGYLCVSWYLGYEDRKGQEVYNQAYYALRKAEASGAGVEPEGVPADLFEQVSEEHGLARVSDLALPQLALLRFQEGNVDEAIELYKAFQAENRDDDPYVAMTRLALAGCYEAKEDYASAIRELGPIVENPDAMLREQALVRLVRLLLLNGQPDKARQSQETLARDYPESPFVAFTEGLME